MAESLIATVVGLRLSGLAFTTVLPRHPQISRGAPAGEACGEPQVEGEKQKGEGLNLGIFVGFLCGAIHLSFVFLGESQAKNDGEDVDVPETANTLKQLKSETGHDISALLSNWTSLDRSTSRESGPGRRSLMGF